MIIKLNKDKQDNSRIESVIGKQLDLSEKISDKKFGSSLYNLRGLRLHDNIEENIPSENSRCNFGKFKKGILLRINDNQKLYGIALSKESLEKMNLIKGKEKVAPLSLTSLLISIGINTETIKKYRILSGGIYNDFLQLEIVTKLKS